MEYKYDVAISFAGENRNIARELAKKLEEHDIKVFFDEFEESDLWGKDLYEYLSKVYSEDARFCLMIISEHYAKKAWTNLERRNAQERAFKENEEYILPIRLDGTKIPGVRDTIGYLDLRHKEIDDIVNATLEKLGREPLKEAQNDSSGNNSSSPQPRMPNIKRQYSDKDKEDFLYDSFSFIEQYLENGLSKLEKEHTNTETSFRKVNEWEIVGKIYKDGKEIKAFRVWIGGMFSSNSICYQEGSTSIGQNNSFNEAIIVEEKDNKLQLNATMGMMGFGKISDIETKEDAAAYLWERIINTLEY